jgi:hypothetical protein
MSGGTISEWEPVLTVHDYYDGPRNGIAEYRGSPHVYKCEWDNSADDWSAYFLLSPISDEQLAAVTEDWSIWRRYQAQFHASSLQHGDKHPALAIDWPRHDQLRRAVEDALEINEANAVRAMPEFRGSIEPTHDFEVRWLPLGE